MSEDLSLEHTQAGELVGRRYLVERALGSGGMGVVYLAVDQLVMRRPVVLKFPHKSLLYTRGFRDRFQREMSSLVAFEHQNVVRVYDIGEHKGSPFMVLQYLAGGSFAEQLNGGPCPPGKMLQWLPRIAAALDSLHEQNFIHRDVKSGNILFDGFGQPYLGDFGIVKILTDLEEAAEGESSTGGHVPGSPESLAPEWSERHYTPAYDQYGLALVVYRGLTGRLPYSYRTMHDLAAKISHIDPLPIEQFVTVSPGFSHELMKALSRRPQDRHPSCTELVRRLIAAAPLTGDPLKLLPPLPPAGLHSRPDPQATRPDDPTHPSIPSLFAQELPSIIVEDTRPRPRRDHRWVPLMVLLLLLGGGLYAFKGRFTGLSLPASLPAALHVRDDLPALSPDREPTTPGEMDACGQAFATGTQGFPQDDVQAVHWFRAGATQGHASAQAHLGQMYEQGRGNLTRNEIEAVSWYRKAANQGNALGQTRLGVMLEEGRGGLRRNDKEALGWYRKAAGQGEAEAQDRLGLMYETARGGLEKNDAEAVSWYRKAAEQGNAAAQKHLGWMYESGGGGLAQSDAEALRWYRKAAEQGNAAAQNNLGLMYENGRGGLRASDEEAVAWYRKAAEQGEAPAQNNLGVMYQSGRGVPHSDREAVLWYRRAAQQGNAAGQNNLGVMYESGRGGLPRSEREAVRWFTLAARQGNAAAQAHLRSRHRSW